MVGTLARDQIVVTIHMGPVFCIILYSMSKPLRIARLERVTY
jgi:hypothetical protein